MAAILDDVVQKVVDSLHQSVNQENNEEAQKDHHPIENKDDKNHSAGSIDKTLISGEKETEESTKQEVHPEESGEEDSGDLVLSHHEVMVKVQSTLSDIISTDPLLYDLPPQVTLEEINSYIALEHGKAMVINVRRADDEVLPIVVTQEATVLDLKHAIKRFVNLKQERANDKTCISWRYVWRRYWLYYNGVKLTEDKKQLKDYGLGNRDEVTFIKRLKEKGKYIETNE